MLRRMVTKIGGAIPVFPRLPRPTPDRMFWWTRWAYEKLRIPEKQSTRTGVQIGLPVTEQLNVAVRPADRWLTREYMKRDGWLKTGTCQNAATERNAKERGVLATEIELQ